MNKSRLLGTAIACVLIIISTVTNAALFEVDWKTPGDKLLTLDTDTGIEWLDLTETTGYSYKAISSELVFGGLYDGFMYANRSDVYQLIDNAGILPAEILPASSSDPAVHNAALDLMNMIGITRVQNVNSFDSAGLTSDSLILDGRSARYKVNLRAVDDTYTDVYGTQWQYDVDGNSYVGSWLYRESTYVPIPPTLWLFGSGLLGLIGIIRKK